MVFLRRMGEVATLWLPVVAAVLICYTVSAWSSGRQGRPDATSPALPLRPGERRGPSAEEVIERLSGTGPQSAGSAGLVE